MNARIEQQHAVRYILGGRAEVVFKNVDTGNQFRYHIKEARDNFWFVNLDVGNKTAPAYIGYITNFYFKMNMNCEFEQGMKTFGYVWRQLNTLTLPDNIHIYHTGVCSVCHRKLTDADSIIIGMGPICACKLNKKLHK